jgi:molybdopterin synthase sulfur carrier subunit
MSLTFTIPGPLRDLAGQRSQVRIDAPAQSVSDALGLLWKQCPAVRDRVITERGDVRQHVNIFVDGESIRDADGLRTKVRDGAEIVILPAVSGG